MEFHLEKTDVTKKKCDLLIVTSFEKQKITGNLKKVDDKLNGQLVKKIKNNNFKGEYGKSITIDTLGRIPASTVIVLGLGKKRNLPLTGYTRQEL